MKVSRIFPLKVIIYIALLISSFHAINLCLGDTGRPAGYDKLFLLPLSFFISIALFYFSFFREQLIVDNLPCFLMVVLTFLRNVFTPIEMVTDSYVSSLGIANAQAAELSILLVFYETIIIYLCVFISQKIRFKQSLLKVSFVKENVHLFNILLGIMIAIAVISIVLVPALRSHYYSIFTSGFTSTIQDDSSYRGGVLTRVLGTGGDMAIAAVRYVLPCYFFYKLAYRGQTMLHLMVSLVIVLLQCFFMTDSNAYILMLMISQVFFIIKLYPKYQKLILIGLASMVLVLAFAMYFNRFALDHYSKSISLWLQSYIPGIANTAGVMNIKPSHRILQIFDDIWVAIPFKSFLGYSGNTMSLAQIWIQTNNCRGQIMSTVGQSYYYFGVLFSPIISCFLIQKSRKCQKKTQSIDNALLSAAYIYLMIYSAVTPFVYNFCIYLQAFLQRTVFIFLIAYFAPYRFSELERLRAQEAYEENVYICKD